MYQFLAARLSEHPSITESLRFQITGFAIVLCALALLWLALTVVGMLFKTRAAVASECAEPRIATSPSSISDSAKPRVPASPLSGESFEHPGHEIAVIAASVAATVEAPHRIVSVHEVTPIAPELLAVIAATIHTMVQAPHRIVSAKRVVATTPTTWYPSAWSAEGRREIFGSHHVR
jgi:Na+-transporting methylmalonyl-CoA/oxaloacetate decarboxylase gamma subunit